MNSFFRPVTGGYDDPKAAPSLLVTPLAKFWPKRCCHLVVSTKNQLPIKQLKPRTISDRPQLARQAQAVGRQLAIIVVLGVLSDEFLDVLGSSTATPMWIRHNGLCTKGPFVLQLTHHA